MFFEVKGSKIILSMTTKLSCYSTWSPPFQVPNCHIDTTGPKKKFPDDLYRSVILNTLSETNFLLFTSTFNLKENSLYVLQFSLTCNFLEIMALALSMTVIINLVQEYFKQTQNCIFLCVLKAPFQPFFQESKWPQYQNSFV